MEAGEASPEQKGSKSRRNPLQLQQFPGIYHTTTQHTALRQTTPQAHLKVEARAHPLERVREEVEHMFRHHQHLAVAPAGLSDARARGQPRRRQLVRPEQLYLAEGGACVVFRSRKKIRRGGGGGAGEFLEATLFCSSLVRLSRPCGGCGRCREGRRVWLLKATVEALHRDCCTTIQIVPTDRSRNKNKKRQDNKK